jgi:beta-glucosidase
MHSSDFGSSFSWGVSTSAFQTEGAHLTEGKGLSIWDVFTTLEGKIKGGHHARTACDFYNRYVHDLILMSYLNIPNFRFSLSWPRILPQGTGERNPKGIDFYNRLIDYCLELGMEPWVTLYHWDLPQALEQKGGWTNRDIINWFTEYVETCVQLFGDRVKHWMVLNEPLVFTGAGHFLGIHAPARKGLNNFLAAAHHATLCQGIGGRVIRALQPNARIGTTFSTTYIDPLDDSRSHRESAHKADALSNRLFLEPLLGMGYPTTDLKFMEGVEKFMRPGDEVLMAFDMDFIGVQHYTREVIRYSALVPYLNARIVNARLRKVPTTAMNWEVYPEGMYHILKKFAAYPQIKSLVVTENGAAFEDKASALGVHDPERIRFFEAYLAQVLRAKREGVKVDGYFAWSFLDNFEWAEGYRPRFGLVHVDHASQKRTIKSSGHWFRRFLAPPQPTGFAVSGAEAVAQG